MHKFSPRRPKSNSLKAKKSKSPFRKIVVIPRPDILHVYLRYAQIVQYLDFLEQKYSSFVQVHTIGTTHEKRPLKVIEIDWCSSRNFCNLSREAQPPRIMSAPSSIKANKPSGCDIISTLRQCETRNVIFIEGGTHAREWITISVALNCIYQLTEKNMRHRDILRKLRFYIIPVVNPDGYEYSMLKVSTSGEC